MKDRKRLSIEQVGHIVHEQQPRHPGSEHRPLRLIHQRENPGAVVRRQHPYFPVEPPAAILGRLDNPLVQRPHLAVCPGGLMKSADLLRCVAIVADHRYRQTSALHVQTFIPPTGRTRLHRNYSATSATASGSVMLRM